jgi:hypothetical protein
MNHKSKTHCSSAIPNNGRPQFEDILAKQTINLAAIETPQIVLSSLKCMDFPSEKNPFSPKPLPKRLGTPYSLGKEPLNCQLELDPTTTFTRRVPSNSTRSLNPLQAIIYTATGQQEASKAHLIAQHSVSKPVTEATSGTPTAYNALIFVRKPC